MPEAAEDGSAGGETKETEAAASQQEFPLLKVAKDRPLKVDICTPIWRRNPVPVLTIRFGSRRRTGDGAYRSIF